MSPLKSLDLSRCAEPCRGAKEINFAIANRELIARRALKSRPASSINIWLPFALMSFPAINICRHVVFVRLQRRLKNWDDYIGVHQRPS